jgi:hypothetical protein
VGVIVYLPRKGRQSSMGSRDPSVMKLMRRKMNASYFDPLDKRCKFLFPDESVLGFNLELGAEYDKPIISNLSSEMKKYGLIKYPSRISAAFTERAENGYRLYLFEGPNFCSIDVTILDYSTNASRDPNCILKPTRVDFLECGALPQIDIGLHSTKDPFDTNSIDSMNSKEHSKSDLNKE